jgi:hypothetical protein
VRYIIIKFSAKAKHMRKLKKIYHMLQLLGMVINYSRKKVSGGAVIVELAVEP